MKSQPKYLRREKAGMILVIGFLLAVHIVATLGLLGSLR